jgi:3-hydroxymyristoyl/3-hydroxydecanoyl-(acyl carrier protein) dehydratase
MMRPSVVESQVDGERAEFLLALETEMDCFAGHFPGHPVLPGVVQIDWAHRLAVRSFDVPAYFTGVRAAKFHRVAGPGQHLRLELTHVPDRRQVQWRYLELGEGANCFSEGSLSYPEG